MVCVTIPAAAHQVTTEVRRGLAEIGAGVRGLKSLGAAAVNRCPGNFLNETFISDFDTRVLSLFPPFLVEVQTLPK